MRAAQYFYWSNYLLMYFFLARAGWKCVEDKACSHYIRECQHMLVVFMCIVTMPVGFVSYYLNRAEHVSYVPAWRSVILLNYSYNFFSFCFRLLPRFDLLSYLVVLDEMMTKKSWAIVRGWKSGRPLCTVVVAVNECVCVCVVSSGACGV